MQTNTITTHYASAQPSALFNLTSASMLGECWIAYNNFFLITSLLVYAGNDSEKKHVCAVGKNPSGSAVEDDDGLCNNNNNNHNSMNSNQHNHTLVTQAHAHTCSLNGVGMYDADDGKRDRAHTNFKNNVFSADVNSDNTSLQQQQQQ